MGICESLQLSLKRQNRLCVWVVGGPCSGRSTQCKLLAQHLRMVHISPETIIHACLNHEQIRLRDERWKEFSRKRQYTYNAIKTHARMTQEEKDFMESYQEKVQNTMAPNSFQRELFSLPNDEPDSDDDENTRPRLISVLQSSMRRGKPIDPRLITILLNKEMKSAKRRINGFLIDGYPRNSDQAEYFIKHIGEPHVILYLECPEEVLKERLSNRANLTQRFDDNELTIPLKLRTFRRDTLPLIQEWMGKLSSGPVNGNRNVEEITASCVDILHEAFGHKFKFKKIMPIADAESRTSNSTRNPSNINMNGAD